MYVKVKHIMFPSLPCFKQYLNKKSHETYYLKYVDKTVIPKSYSLLSESLHYQQGKFVFAIYYLKIDLLFIIINTQYNICIFFLTFQFCQTLSHSL